MNPCPLCRGGSCHERPVDCGSPCGKDRDCQLATPKDCLQCVNGKCSPANRHNVTCGGECVYGRAQCDQTSKCPDCITADRAGNFHCARRTTCGGQCLDSTWCPDSCNYCNSGRCDVFRK